MQNVDQAISQTVPDALAAFLRETCRIPAHAFAAVAASSMPQPARQLLVHASDMTSTLAAFHESALRVEVLRRQQQDDLYLREVFLRTVPADVIVEYGVIGIALEQFTPPQQEAIQAGQIPLGALLHRFQIPFASAPVGYFSVPIQALAETRFTAPTGARCYGRFNRLTKPTGEPLAWILEILPHA